jgi:hypothetical protein
MIWGKVLILNIYDEQQYILKCICRVHILIQIDLHNIYKNQMTDIQNRSKNYHNSYKYEIFLINNKYKKLDLKHILLNSLPV